MNYVISIEGQTIPVPEEIAVDDAKVRAALAPYFPDAANALITRTAKDETTTVNVVKKAGTKGGGELTPLDLLLACPEGRNPAVELYEEIAALDQSLPLDPEFLLSINVRLEAAIASGQEQAKAVEYAAERLKAASAVPSPVLVQGF